MALPVKKNEDPLITISQRKCLSHVMRNTQTAFSYFVSALENSEMTPPIEELSNILEAVRRKLDKVSDALKNNSYCVLDPEECDFVSKYVGCRKEPRL